LWLHALVFILLGVVLAPPQKLPRGWTKRKQGAREHSPHAFSLSPQPLHC